MQRILDPGQIEAFAERSVPRIRLPDPAGLFERRAQRLIELSEGHAVGGYLRLMAAVGEAQQRALENLVRPGRTGSFREIVQRIATSSAQSRAHRMPLIQAAGWQRDQVWRAILRDLAQTIKSLTGFPAAVGVVCERLIEAKGDSIEAQADLLLTAHTEDVDAEAAPFVMAALQVYWTAMSSNLKVSDVAQLDVPTVCPVCGTLPVASVVRADQRSPGYRYLNCALCSTEWHMVRITCSHCLNNEGIAYHSIEGGAEAIRAESCGKCHTYRKILYQEKDPRVEPVADDLASLALDLLMTQEGYHRGSGNPLLWQHTDS